MAFGERTHRFGVRTRVIGVARRRGSAVTAPCRRPIMLMITPASSEGNHADTAPFRGSRTRAAGRVDGARRSGDQLRVQRLPWPGVLDVLRRNPWTALAIGVLLVVTVTWRSHRDPHRSGLAAAQRRTVGQRRPGRARRAVGRLDARQADQRAAVARSGRSVGLAGARPRWTRRLLRRSREAAPLDLVDNRRVLCRALGCAGEEQVVSKDDGFRARISRWPRASLGRAECRIANGFGVSVGQRQPGPE